MFLFMIYYPFNQYKMNFNQNKNKLFYPDQTLLNDNLICGQEYHQYEYEFPIYL